MLSSAPKSLVNTFQTAAFFFFLSIFLCSCTLWSSKTPRVNKKQEALEKRISSFTALLEDIRSEALQKGTTAQEIQRSYGEPNDILTSGSSTGKFEIWSYDKVLTKSDRKWVQIRLYLSDDKLISWSY